MSGCDAVICANVGVARSFGPGTPRQNIAFRLINAIELNEQIGVVSLENTHGALVKINLLQPLKTFLIKRFGFTKVSPQMLKHSAISEDSRAMFPVIDASIDLLRRVQMSFGLLQSTQLNEDCGQIA